MNKQQVIEWLLLNDYHLEDGEYVQTYNSVRHWVTVNDWSIRMYSVYEGTAGDDPIFDTGILENPSATLMSKMLSKSKELKWNG